MKNVSCKVVLSIVCAWANVAFATLEDVQKLYEQGRHTEAMAEVDDMLASRPDDAELRFMKGIILAEGGSPDKAIEVFAGLTQDFPELPEPWNNLAVLFAEKGEFDKSREALLAAIQTHPSYSTAHENLGDLYARMASMAYDRALEKDRANESARLKLSAVNGLFAAPGWNSTNTEPANPIVVAAAEPKPVIRPEPKPVATQPEPKPVVVQPQPEPKPVVVQPQPEPKPKPEPTVAANVTNDVTSAVNKWANAWAGQDVQTYLDSYTSDYRPANGASHGAWARYRRERLTKPSVIEVGLSNIRVSSNDGATATATFSQKYRSDNYRDEVTKVLTLSKSNGTWKIIGEVSQ